MKREIELPNILDLLGDMGAVEIGKRPHSGIQEIVVSVEAGDWNSGWKRIGVLTGKIRVLKGYHYVRFVIVNPEKIGR